MANKPNIFEIDDPDTGKRYRIEADEGVTAEQALADFDALTPEEWTAFEYNPQAPAEATPAPTAAAAPAGPVPVSSGQVVVDAQAQPKANVETVGVMGADQIAAPYENYEIQPLSAEDEQTYIQLSRDPSVSYEELANWAGERGMTFGPEARENLAKLREAYTSGESVSDAVTYERLADSLLGTFTPQIDPTIKDDWTAVLERGMAYNPMGIVTRWINDLTDGSIKGFDKDTLRETYPDLSEDVIEELHDNLIGEMRRRELINANYQVDERNIGAVKQFFGDLVGGASPVDIVPIGRAGTFGGKVAEATVENFFVDMALQASDIAYGAQQRYDPLQGGMAAVTGAALSGGIQAVTIGGNKVLQAFRPSNAAPDPAAVASTSLSGVTAKKGTKEHEQQTAALVNGIADRANLTTKGWTNAPEILVYDSFSSLPQGISRKAAGVYTKDANGNPIVALNAARLEILAKKRNISIEDAVDATIFHETLGHHGLTQRFSSELDTVLTRFYDEGTDKFREMVDKWIEDHPKMYLKSKKNAKAQDPVWQRIRATEEVLAEMSEGGPLARSMFDKLADFVKNFLRERGLNVRLSPREIRGILALGHEDVMTGRPTSAAPSSPRTMYVGRTQLGAHQYIKEKGEDTYSQVAVDALEGSYVTEEIYAERMQAAQTPEERADIQEEFGVNGKSRLVTGWFRGPDGRWRLEITDHMSKVQSLPDPQEGAVPLNKVLKHDELFDLYPSLATGITVKTEYMSGGRLAYFQPESQQIGLNAKYTKEIQTEEGQKEVLSILLHEVQHAVQEIEGFTTGANSQSTIKNLSKEKLEQGLDNYKNYLKINELPYTEALAEAVEQVKNNPETIEMLEAKKASQKAYEKLREVEKRYNANSLNTDIPAVLEAGDKSKEAYNRLNKAKNAFNLSIGYPKYVLRTEGVNALQQKFYYDLVDSLESPGRAERKLLALDRKLREIDELIKQGTRREMANFASNTEGVPFEVYQLVFGEVEARDVEARVSMTPEERRQNVPYASQNIHPDDYLFRDGPGGIVYKEEGPVNDVNYQAVKRSLQKRRNELGAIDSDLQSIREQLNELPGTDFSRTETLGQETLEAHMEYLANLLEKYYRNLPEMDFNKVDSRIVDEMLQIQREAEILQDDAFAIYNSLVQEQGVNDNPFNPFRPTPRVGKSIFTQTDPRGAAEFYAGGDFEDIKEDAGSGGMLDVADNDRYMMVEDDEFDVDNLSDDDIFSIRAAQDIVPQLLEGYESQGPVSWDFVKKEAAARALPSNYYNKATGVEDLSKKLYKYDNLSTRMNNRLVRLHERMQKEGPSPDLKLEYMEVMFKYKELVGRIFDAQSEVGRALNLLKQLTLTRRKAEGVAELLKEYENSGNPLGAFASDDNFRAFSDQIMYLMATGNQQGVNTTVRSIEDPYWWQYILTARHASMLSGLGTHVKNAYDGLMMIAREMEETLIAVPGYYIRKGLKAAGKDVKDGVSPQEAAARAYGLLRAALDGQTYMDTMKAFREGHQSRAYSAKIEMQDARIPFISKVNDALYASDIFFRNFHTNANLYSLGVRSAIEDGFTGMRAFEEGTSRALSPSKDMLDQARKLTDTALLVDSPSGMSAWAETQKSIKPGMDAGSQAKSFVFNIMFPFLRVTDRLLFQEIRRSPLSVLDKNTRADWAAGGAARDIAVARTLYGTLLIAHYWNEAGTPADEEGDIEGTPPGDYRKQQSLEATGYRPNSVVEDGNMVDATALNLSLNPLGTRNNIATHVASIRQGWDRGYLKEEDVANGLIEAIRGSLVVFTSQSYAENMAMYVSPFVETNPDQQDPAFAAMAGSLASQFVPAAVRQVNQQVIDPIKRDTRGDKSVGDRILGRVISGIPGLSQTLPARSDFLGDEMPQGRTTFGIGNYTAIKQDEVSQEIRKLDRATEEPVLSGVKSSFQHNGEKIELTTEQQQQWTSLKGQYTRIVMGELIRLSGWKNLTTAEKVEIVKEVQEESYQEAKKRMIQEMGLPE